MDVTNKNCDCFAQFDQLRDSIKYDIVFCPMHEAAPELLEALKTVEYVHFMYFGKTAYRCPWCKVPSPNHREDCIRQAAIRAGEGDE